MGNTPANGKRASTRTNTVVQQTFFRIEQKVPASSSETNSPISEGNRVDGVLMKPPQDVNHRLRAEEDLMKPPQDANHRLFKSPVEEGDEEHPESPQEKSSESSELEKVQNSGSGSGDKEDS
jgi:hypothetical protein